MQLLSSWKKSLQIFEPQNLKNFIAESVTLFVRVLPDWFRKCWWLLLMCTGAIIFSGYITQLFFGHLKDVALSHGTKSLFLPSRMFTTILWGLQYFIDFLLLSLFVSWCAVVLAKTSDIFFIKKYIKHLLYILLSLVLLVFLMQFLLNIEVFYEGKLWGIKIVSALFAWYLPTMIYHMGVIILVPPIALIIFILFFISRNASLRALVLSIVDSLKFFLFNYPALYLIGAVCSFPVLIFYFQYQQPIFGEYSMLTKIILNCGICYLWLLLLFAYSCFAITYLNKNMLLEKEA